MSHGVVRTDLMSGTDVAADLVSLKYGTVSGDDFTAAAIDNGNVVLLDGYMEGEREIFKAVIPTATSKINDLVLVASEEVMADERKRNLEDFENEAGKAARGYRLRSGNIFSVTADAVKNCKSTDIAKGDVVSVAASTLWQIGGSEGTAIGKIMDVEIAGRRTYYVVKID